MSNKQYLCATTAAAILALACGSAQAQGRGEAASRATDVEEVVVTGSFIAGTPEDSSIPVEAVTLEELRQQGTPSNLDLVRTMSEVGSVAGESNRSNLFAVGAASINLRGVGSNRTVVLFNGRRLPDQYSFSVGRFNNINIVPNAAIGRIETLKDGGATTYGADAVGGVVNYITRRNLDGVEVNANYRFIKDSKGDYDADVSWGKVGDSWNAMAIVGYQRRNELDTADRDFALQDYLLNPTGWSSYGAPGAYTFQRAGQTAVITPGATATSGNRFAGDYQIGASGLVRDPACAALGGFAGFSSASAPICYYQTSQTSNLIEEQETWQAYAEINYEFERGIRLHLEGLFYDLNVPHIPLDAFTSVPQVFPIGNATTGATQNIGGSAYGVAGSNPAVRQFLSTLRNSDGTLAFGDPGTPGTQAFQTVNGGRVGLTSGFWRPFGAAGTPAPELEEQQNQNRIYRFTAEVSGDLPQVWGTKLRWSVAGTFNLSNYEIKFNDILVDRLQAALNGFGGPGCTGTTPGANGCYYFNPFSSAMAANQVTGSTNPLFVGTGSFTGYLPGAGLQNNPEVVRWLYAPLYLKRRGEYSIYDVLVSGETGLRLWAEDEIAVAVGSQYRYFREEADLSSLIERSINPCATPGVQVCATRSGPGVFSRGSGVTGFTDDQDRRFPVASAFAEIQAPVFDNLIVNLSGRYEKFFSDRGARNNDVFVPQASTKWQVTDWLALRGTVSKSFSNIDPPGNRPAIITTGAAPAEFGGTSVLFVSNNYANFDVKPEKGINYNVGAILQVGDLRANIDYYYIKVDDLLREQTTGNIIPGLVQAGQTGITALINCSSPLLSETQDALGGRPFVQLNGPCVQGQSRINSPAGGGGLVGGNVNFFGASNGLRYLVNSGYLQTDGIDLTVSYRLQDVLGGDITLTADWSHVLSYEQSAFVVGGVEVAPGFDGVGQLNDSPGRTFNPRIAKDRGSFTFNFRRGRHNLNWQTRFTSSLINDDLGDYQELAQYNANIANSAGVLPSGAACADNNPSTPPVPAGAGTGVYGPFCAGQNYTIGTGRKVPWAWTTDVSYQVDLPWETVVTFTVQNLFDEEPGFSRTLLGYEAGLNSPVGRSLRVGVRKRF
ncbi:TonB-dependent receptor domain-containing protein [Phenylobacterium sp.]|jgi:iron complex outermembrane receptor protein|uniref:TonB-dependent receptor domain-containing protein n=1 Tax=Phenylobacterium sp. TaxID=1871053 RepID=UPI002F954B7F